MPSRAEPRKAHKTRLPPSIAKFAILQNCMRKFGVKGKTPETPSKSSTPENSETSVTTSLSDAEIDNLDTEAARELVKKMRDRLKEKDFEIFKLKYRVESLTVQNQELVNHVKDRRASTLSPESVHVVYPTDVLKQAVLIQRRRSQQEGGQRSEVIHESPLRVSDCTQESL